MFLQDRAAGGQRMVTSASDLTAASKCEFAWLRRVDAKLGRDVEVPPDDDPMMARAARLGDAHEERVLRRYREQLGEGAIGSPGGVVSISRPDSLGETDLAAALEQTREALAGGAEAVFQATFFDPSQRAAIGDDPEIGFVGFADFLRRMPDGSYEVQDAKLARRARVTALMQLAAYAEQLERIGIPVASEAVLIHGDDARTGHRLADIAPVFRARRERLHRILLDRVAAIGPDGRRESAAPVAWMAAGVLCCGRCEVCGPEVERTRDPLLIAGIRRSQRDRLVAAGLDTIEAVAAADAAAAVAAPGISPPVAVRLVAQARAQLAAVEGQPPPVSVVEPEALGTIPRPSPGDLFFDFEGDPLYREPGEQEGARWGIDYLFGMVDAHERFTPIWAHTLDEERRALERFLALVAERRRRHPAMRIYHYAAYERTHLLGIAARHGVGEAEVDRLLRENVLVDLYPIVRRALRVGSRSYSIKKLEPLYMGGELRDEAGVTSGAQSVAEYAEASALLAANSAAERAEGQRRLDGIADYNRYDCVSTLRLRDWLLRLAAAHGVQPGETGAEESAGAGEQIELSATAAALATHAALAEDQPDRRAAALAGSAIDYHQREQKAFWWAHFARLVDPIEDWSDMRDTMVVDAAASGVDHDWRAPEGRARAHRRRLRLHGELAPGSRLKEGSDAYLLYEAPAPFEQFGAQPGARGARMARVVERHEDGVTVEETRGGDAPGWNALPVALAPGPPPRPGAQKTAIEEWGRKLAAALDRGHPYEDPVFDVMRRVPPRLADGEPLVDPASPEALAAGGGEDSRTLGAVIASLRKLRRSALAVQGPPGTGKTYLAARAIRALVQQDGWRIGVVAQSHRVVEHLLEVVVAAGVHPSSVGKAPQGGVRDPGAVEPGYTVLGRNGHAAFLGEHRAAGRGCVIGGTAWDFSNDRRVARGDLDLLVVDEAGQFALAPTIAASVAAERLLLLGDPQQLPQVSQGAHPEPIDASALGWLLGDSETLPQDSGYFLAETRRMRPELAEAVSQLAYGGRLRAHPAAAQREVEGVGPAGLVWHPVRHRGNSTSSAEEAEEVVRIARRALSGTLREPGEAHPLAQRDVIVVAAYNAQVECAADALAAAGLGEVRVGTVDRFQGQEAVIAIVTLAASSAEDVPRGLEFLLMRNRLNVAISRGQWAAHLVSSDRLGDGLPGTAQGLAALSGYLRLIENATVEAW